MQTAKRQGIPAFLYSKIFLYFLNLLMLFFGYIGEIDFKNICGR